MSNTSKATPQADFFTFSTQLETIKERKNSASRFPKKGLSATSTMSKSSSSQVSEKESEIDSIINDFIHKNCSMHITTQTELFVSDYSKYLKPAKSSSDGASKTNKRQPRKMVKKGVNYKVKSISPSGLKEIKEEETAEELKICDEQVVVRKTECLVL
jgi:hypothetical protein